MIISYWFIILLIVEKTGLWSIMNHAGLHNEYWYFTVILWDYSKKSWFFPVLFDMGMGVGLDFEMFHLQRDSSKFLVISIHYQSMFCF